MSNSTQEYFGLKELYSVVIRAFTDIKIGNHFFEKGEPILYFEKLQISELTEKGRIISARGGQGNYPHVIWENFGDLSFALTEGVLSKMSFGMLASTGVFDYKENERVINVPKKEQVIVSNNKVTLMEKPLEEKIYIYKIDEQGFMTDRIKNFEIKDIFDKAGLNYICLAGDYLSRYEKVKEIIFKENYDEQEIIVDYYYKYTKAYTNYTLGNKRIDGLLSLEGKAYFKDENNGLNQTFLFEIPKMKITSNIDIIMGEKASPNVSVFNVIGLPIKENNQFVVSKMYLLSDDIDATI